MSVGHPPTRLHLVVDTGVDDALALVVSCLHPALRLVGVTAAAGNTTIERSLANTLHVLHLLGADAVPVSRGAAQRHDGRPFDVRGVHGPDGLAGLGPPGMAAVQAAPLQVDPCATLVCLAPLTTLLCLRPGEVVAGYARPGEANEAMDPEAAALVRRTWLVRDAVVTTPSPVLPEPTGHSALARLVRALGAHQGARGAGIGDAEVVLGLAGDGDDPGRTLWSLLERAESRGDGPPTR